ncbi:MAG: hypothetical protein AABY22_12215, partial [Nanoarchaeota archaeon]
MQYKNCLVCGNLFQTWVSRIKKGWGKYCSRKCSDSITLIKKGNIPIAPFQKGQIPWNKKEKIAISCKKCSGNFYIQAHRLKTAKYCSKECYLIAHTKNTQTKICLNCKTEFKVPLYKIAIAKYCSRKCQNIHLGVERRGEKCHLWKGGELKRKCLMCGEWFLTYTNKFCSKECFYKFRFGKPAFWNIGSKNGNWQGGKTSIDEKV